ncbi:MAG: hypothetical protein ACREE7_01310, partial [Dongiaceae bacterium]
MGDISGLREPIVIAGLEPAIQEMPETTRLCARRLDCRVKPANDSERVAGARSKCQWRRALSAVRLSFVN